MSLIHGGSTLKFNIDSPFFRFLTTLADFVVLNIVFLLSCVPIFTIGTSLTALYHVTMQEARTEHGYILRNYFTSWKQNFKQSTAIWTIYFVLGAILLFNLSFWYALKSTAGNIVLAVLLIATAVYVVSFMYLFPLQARFANPIRQTIKNSVFIALQNLRMTLLLLLINGLFAALCRFVPQALIFMIFLGFAFIAYCNSFLFVKVFTLYEAKESSSDGDDSL